jgi:polyisoprenoid-binding protein YceI
MTFLGISHLLSALLVASQPVPPGPIVAVDTGQTVWQIDKGHSDISFRIRHFVSRVRGTFHDWNGTIRSDSSDWRDGFVDVTIQASSIDTQNDTRDASLRSSDFFEVDKYPTITFRSTGVEVDGTSLRIAGDLTMHGVTRPIILQGTYLGATSNPQGKPRAGFEATATINRLDYGVKWNRVVEGGGVMLGDEVEVEISVEAVRQS